MKDKILTFIIGFLVGTIITAGVFFIYTKINNTNKMNNKMNGQPPQMMQDENRDFKGKQENIDGGTTSNNEENNSKSDSTEKNSTNTKKDKQKNSGSNSQENKQENPPAKPEEQNQNSSSNV